MRSHITSALLTMTVLAVALQPARAQQTTVYNWIPTGTADWNVDENWMALAALNVVPDADFVPGEVANIGNGGTAVVDEMVPRVAGLTVANGAVEIQDGGGLSTVNDGVGNGAISIGTAGAIRIAGNGQLTVDGNLTNAGVLHVTGPDASLQVAGGFTNSGTLVAGITDPANHSILDVAGHATLGGTLRVEAADVTPEFGHSWDLIQAASFSGQFALVDASLAPPLARGLQYHVLQQGDTASLAVDNALILTVDRQTGTGMIENAIGTPIEITGYAIRSERGLLSAEGWTSAAESNAAGSGWTEANPTVNHLAELNLTNSFSFEVGQTLDLGMPYSGGPSKPFEEDVAFQYTTPDGRIEQGIVEYTGAINDFTLFVDPESGAAALGNISRFIETPVITGYAILSESASLDVDSWVSFTESGEAGEGWRTANPDSGHLSELNLTGSAAFPNGTLISLGEIFNPTGQQDLQLQYATLAGELLLGTVQYGEIPVPPMDGLPGDYNNNGRVEQADLDLVLLNWGQSFDTLPGDWMNERPTEGIIDQAELDGVLLNWGNTAGLGTAAVPEPSTMILLAAMAVALASIGPFRDFRSARHRCRRATAQP